MPNFVNSVGPSNGRANLMIVGEHPGIHEDKAGVPFVGPAGDMLNEDLAENNFHRNEAYIANVFSYMPPFGDIKKYHLIDIDENAERERLWREISRVKPNCILAFGNEALQTLTGETGILNWRGSILTAKDGITKVVPTIHHAALFSYGNKEGLPYVYRQLIRHDIARAIDESRESRLELPSRNLVVARNHLDLYRFWEEYKNCDRVAVDIESINSVAVCVGFAFNHYHAISVPLLKSIGPVELTPMPMKEIVYNYRIIDEILSSKKIIGQNFKYDDFKLSLFGFQCKNVYSDTLIKTRIIFPELPSKKLNVQSSIWTREPYYKEEGKEPKFGKFNVQKFFLYNAKDCAVNFEIDEAQEQDLIDLSDKYHLDLRSYYYDYQMKKHKFYLELENNGFRIDHARKAELKTKYTGLALIQHEKLESLIGHELNVKSPKQKKALFTELGLPIFKHQPTAEDSIVKMLGNHCKGNDGPKKRAILEAILEETRIRDQKSRYIDFDPDFDNRCKSSFNIIATETCRSSTSVPKKPVRPIQIGLAFHTISKHGRLAKDIRSMFIPDPGKVFVQVDASTAEPRVVAVLCKDWELLKAFGTVDIHRRTAALVLGLTDTLDLSPRSHISDKLGKDSPERFCGKKTRNGGNYDMKKRRFMTEVNTDAQKFEINLSISEWKGGQMLERFHAASPKIRSVFHAEIQEAITSSRTIIDPMGGVRIFHGMMDDSLFQEAYANIPQRTIAHLVQGAALKTHEELGDLVGHVSTHPINFISENHDSFLMMMPEKMVDEVTPIINKHMTADIDFSRYCTLKRDYILNIPCDLEVSDRTYADMIDIKKWRERAEKPLSLMDRFERLKNVIPS